jgi:hypothetical protein
MIVICDRKVKIGMGQKSQTINICTKENKHGVYDYRIRIRPPSVNENTLLSLKPKKIEDLVDYIVKNFAGIIEQYPNDRKQTGVTTDKDTSIAKRERDSKASQSHDSSMLISDWNGKKISALMSHGGVLALKNPFYNLISNNILPWPPPEIVQKLYISRHLRAFNDNDRSQLKEKLGYYSDLQSMHSEDALTWSVFGTIAHSEKEKQIAWVNDFLKLLNIKSSPTKHANIWLWRTTPHPDTSVSGGPEIDFGIQTTDTLVIGEAKWLSGVGQRQGKKKDKDQITLRKEFVEKYGNIIYPEISKFVILAISPYGGLIHSSKVDLGRVNIYFRDLTWKEICDLKSHPWCDETKRYLNWKLKNSKMNR